MDIAALTAGAIRSLRQKAITRSAKAEDHDTEPTASRTAARQGLDTFDDMFLDNVPKTTPEPPASSEQRARAWASNPLEEIDSVFRRSA
jgi:hypothetical protein